MSRGFLESAASWSGVLAVGLTALAALCGILAWHFSSRLANVKDEDFKRFKEEASVAVASANEKSARANARAAVANRIAEEERLARVKLEARLAPRSLKGESQNAVVRAIEQFAPQPYDILWYADDPESENLANDIYAAIQRAGWVLDQPTPSWLGSSVVLGVVIEFAPSQKDIRNAVCNALASALQQEEIYATVQPRTDDDREKRPLTLRIKVGKKP